MKKEISQEMSDQRAEMLAQIFELAMRINLETEFAAFVSVSGHISQISISISKGKKDYFLDKMTKHEFYYHPAWEDHSWFPDFMESAKIAITDLNNILSATWTKTYKAYCNLIDMGCEQVFTSEEAAKKWCAKMKRKYNKVHAIVDYREELRA